MSRRRDILELLSTQPRSVSSLAAALGLRRDEAADDLAHAIRTARAAGARVVILPSSCKSCGFTFGAEKLAKPGRCPACKGTRLFEAQISIARE